MKNLKSLLVIPFFFYATEGYVKAFNVAGSKWAIALFVILNFSACVALAFTEFQFFGNSDLDGIYTQIALAEFIYLVFGFGLHLFAGLAENE